MLQRKFGAGLRAQGALNNLQWTCRRVDGPILKYIFLSSTSSKASMAAARCLSQLGHRPKTYAGWGGVDAEVAAAAAAAAAAMNHPLFGGEVAIIYKLL